MFENNYIQSITNDLYKQKDNIILEQLNDLISRDLLIVEETQPVLVRDFESNKITLRQSVRLVLKDKEYIEKLERENKELKDTLTKMNELAERLMHGKKGL